MPGESFVYRNGELHVDELPARELARVYGTPLYVYSGRTLLARYREFYDAFAPLDRLVAYSVKANGNLSILRILGAEGAGTDVVSGGELYRASLAGIPPDRIVFSGVGKTREELTAALRAGIYAINVESEGELALLAEVAESTGCVAPVALRINPDIDCVVPHRYIRTGHRASKFGIASDDALRLYRRASSRDCLEIRGISSHIGSQILDPEPYLESLLLMLSLAADLEAEGIGLEYLDIGGGFGVAYEPDGVTPGIGQFADVIVPHLINSKMKLVLEPGRFLVAPAGVLLAKVLYVKRTGNRTFLVVDAGMNDLLRPSHYEGFHPIEPVELRTDRPVISVDVVGPLCETGDFLALDRDMPELYPGELIAINLTGAYGYSMSSTYNARTRPAEVLVEDGVARLIRRRETHADLVRGEEELLI